MERVAKPGPAGPRRRCGANARDRRDRAGPARYGLRGTPNYYRV